MTYDNRDLREGDDTAPENEEHGTEAMGAGAGALGGAAVGAAVGGLAGALVGLGIPEFEAKVYEGKIRSGNVLIACHTRTSDDVKRAKDIFEARGATDITTGGERQAPDRDRDLTKA